jgi:kynureninase
VLSLAALDGALDAFDDVDMEAVREKSRALGDLFVDAALERCAEHGLVLACPRDSSKRGSQVSFAHPEGYAIVQALIERGVVGDFRTPDVLRFGLAPLYVRFEDVWHAARHLGEVLESGEWDAHKFRQRSAVT